MSHPIQSRLAAVFVHVRNLRRAVEFYSRLLGLAFDPAAHYTNAIHILRLPGGVDLLLDANHADAVTLNTTFPLHATCMFPTDDIDAAHAWLAAEGQALGAQIITPIHRDPQVSFFNFTDPDGNIQMICQTNA